MVSPSQPHAWPERDSERQTEREREREGEGEGEGEREREGKQGSKLQHPKLLCSSPAEAQSAETPM